MSAPTPPPRRELGLLIPVVIRGSHLQQLLSAPADQQQSTFALLWLSSNPEGQQRTKVSGGGAHAVWDDEFRFRIFEPAEGEKEYLHLRVMREGRGEQEDEVIGEVRVQVGKDVGWKENKFDESVQITHKKQYRGEVLLELTFYPVLETPPRASSEQLRQPTKLEAAPRPTRAAPAVPTAAVETGVADLSLREHNGVDARNRRRSAPPPPPKADHLRDRRLSSMSTTASQASHLPFPGESDPPEIPQVLRPGRPGRVASEESTLTNGGSLPLPQQRQQPFPTVEIDRLPSPANAQAYLLPPQQGPAPHEGWTAIRVPKLLVQTTGGSLYSLAPVSTPTSAVASDLPQQNPLHQPHHPMISRAPPPPPASTVSPNPAMTAPLWAVQPQPQSPAYYHQPPYPTSYSSPPPTHSGAPSSAPSFQTFAPPPHQQPYFPPPQHAAPPQPFSPPPFSPPLNPTLPSPQHSFHAVAQTQSPPRSPSPSGMPGALPGGFRAEIDAASRIASPPPVPSLTATRHSSHNSLDRLSSPPPRPSTVRPLPVSPAGNASPASTPALDAKRREAGRDVLPPDTYAPAPPPWSPPVPPRPPMRAGGGSVTPSPQNSLDRTVQEKREREEERLRVVGMEEEQAATARKREEAEEAKRASQREREEQEKEEAERRRRVEREAAEERRLAREEADRLAAAERAERSRRIEAERLERIRAEQQARAERLKMEQEDARLAAQYRAEVAAEEQAQREAEEQARAMAREMAEEDERARKEREREDEEFARQMREEEDREEEERRRERERRDEEYGRRLAQGEEEERERRMVEDERLARELASQEADAPGR